MRNTVASACAAITTSINWDDLPESYPQDVIDAANSGDLRNSLTEWVRNRGWMKLAILTLFRDNRLLTSHPAVEMTTLFRDGRGVTYYYRDGRFDNFPNSAGKEGTFRIVTLSEKMTFKKMAQSATSLKTESLAELSRAIVSQGLDITPKQWEDQIVATQAGADILCKNEWASFAFVKTGKVLTDDKGCYEEIAVLWAYRSRGGEWDAGVGGLGIVSEWDDGNRLLLRNCKGS